MQKIQDLNANPQYNTVQHKITPKIKIREPQWHLFFLFCMTEITSGLQPHSFLTWKRNKTRQTNLQKAK